MTLSNSRPLQTSVHAEIDVLLCAISMWSVYRGCTHQMMLSIPNFHRTFSGCHFQFRFSSSKWSTMHPRQLGKYGIAIDMDTVLHIILRFAKHFSLRHFLLVPLLRFSSFGRCSRCRGIYFESFCFFQFGQQTQTKQTDANFVCDCDTWRNANCF